MSNLRALAEKDLATTLEGDWSTDVRLIAPDGIAFSAKGQVLYNLVRQEPLSGERIVSETLVVTLRRSSLSVSAAAAGSIHSVPQPGENWIIEVPVSPILDAPIGQYALNSMRPPEGGAAIGFIRLYLQYVEQIV